MKKTRQNQLETFRIALESLLARPDMLSKLSRFGFDQKAVLKAKALYEKVYMLESIYDENMGLQLNATRKIREDRKALHKVYMQHLALARIALQDQRDLWNLLKMDGRRKEDLAGWLQQIRAFYTHIAKFQENVEKFGLTQDEIAQATAMLEAISLNRVDQTQGKSSAQDATQQKEEAFQQLQDWMQELRYIARYALKENIQQLEILGVVVKS